LGKGRSEQLLQQLADSLGIKDDVQFLGFAANPYPFLGHCQALVHSAKFEGLPTVLVEGLMLDRLIVATDCPTGPREILADGKAGMLVPVGDAEAMAEALHKVLTDAGLQERLHEGIRKQQRAFSFETIERQIDALLAS
jgi:glycosyltransferase involved in cell wall biosynthesis